MSLLLTLQQAYEDAYQGSVHAIVLETRNEHVEALHAWKATLRKISLNLASVTETPQSSQEIDLMTNIMNVEKQCHDRIAFLERGWTDTNPYASYMTNSDDYISSQISNHYHHTSSTSTSNQSPYVPDHYSNPSFVDLSSSNYHQFQNATASSPPPFRQRSRWNLHTTIRPILHRIFLTIRADWIRDWGSTSQSTGPAATAKHHFCDTSSSCVSKASSYSIVRRHL